MKQTPLLTLKQRHTDILLLLFRFRFLTRPQIQQLLTLKNHQKVLRWLNELAKSQYATKYQSSVSSVATYSLGRAGRKYLVKNKLVKQAVLLDRVWREYAYSSGFREKCLLIADMYLQLVARSGGALRFWTKSELHGVENMIEPAPDAYIIVNEKSEADRIFLEVPTVARTKNVMAQIERYSEYFFSREWQEHTDKPFPKIVIICPNRNVIKSTLSFIKEEFADEPDLRFRVASSDQALEEILPKEKA